MKREQIEERKWFTKDEKYYILSKSHGRCSHCGKPIRVGSDFTVEHVIPISKGGTNDITNVVALCKECNDAKSDYIVFPHEYFRYLDKEFMDELYDNQIDYYKNVNWFELTNFLPEDKFEVCVEMNIDTLASKRLSLKHKGKNFRDMYLQRNIYARYIASKAVYSDLDDIYYYVIKYNAKYGILSTKENIKKQMCDIFRKGAFYTVRNSAQELVLVVPVALSGISVNQEKRCMVRVLNPMCMYNKPQYHKLLKEFMNMLFGSILDIQIDRELEYRVALLECAKTDDVSRVYFDSVGGYNYLCDVEGDADDNMMAGLITIRDKSEKGSEYTMPLGETISILSEAMLNKLNLKLEDVIMGRIPEDGEETCNQ